MRFSEIEIVKIYNTITKAQRLSYKFNLLATNSKLVKDKIKFQNLSKEASFISVTLLTEVL
jgi:hypothetical protein